MPEPLSLSFLALTASGALLGADPSRPGVYRSTDGGRTWSLSGVPGDKIGAFTVDGASGAIYVTTYGGKLFETTDGGDSWQTAPTDLAYGAIVTDPSDPATSYAAAWGNPAGIVKSVDHGHTWTAADKGVHSTVITSLAFVPTGPATLYAGTLGNQLFKSTNRGRTWRSASAGLGNSSVSTLAVEARRPHTIFAGTQWSGLFKTTDGGLSWHRVPIGFPAKAQARVPAVAVGPAASGHRVRRCLQGRWMRRPRRLPEVGRRRLDLAADHDRALAGASDRDRPAQDEDGVRRYNARRPLPKQGRRQQLAPGRNRARRAAGEVAPQLSIRGRRDRHRPASTPPTSTQAVAPAAF